MSRIMVDSFRTSEIHKNQAGSEDKTLQYFKVMQKAENLMNQIDFDTEYIDSIVAENDQMVIKKDKIQARLDEMTRKEKETKDKPAKSIPKLQILLRKSTEMLSLSPRSNRFPQKRLNRTSSVLSPSKPINDEDDLFLMERSLQVETREKRPDSGFSDYQLYTPESSLPTKRLMKTFSLREINHDADRINLNELNDSIKVLKSQIKIHCDKSTDLRKTLTMLN